MRKSNKWDTTCDVLRLECRQRQLHQQERTKRRYEKVNEGYWETGISEVRQEKRNKSKD